MDSMKQLLQEVKSIKERNQRVEADKAWETSWERKVLIAVLTYLLVVLFFGMMNLPKPWINAFVPTLGFVLSTLTLSFAKRWWISKKEK